MDLLIINFEQNVRAAYIPGQQNSRQATSTVTISTSRLLDLSPSADSYNNSTCYTHRAVPGSFDEHGEDDLSMHPVSFF